MKDVNSRDARKTFFIIFLSCVGFAVAFFLSFLFVILVVVFIIIKHWDF